jgi:hypothetical protein
MTVLFLPADRHFEMAGVNPPDRLLVYLGAPDANKR